MTKSSYTGAKTHFFILEAAAMLILLAGVVVTILVYRKLGLFAAGGSAFVAFLAFISTVAVSQIGRATINMAEDTRRIADMMQADRKVSARPHVPAAKVDASNQLVARR